MPYPPPLPTGDAFTPINGTPISILKVGTAAEAAGSWYCYSKDTGFPGAWAPGAPGLNGRATDGTTAADAGCLPIANASLAGENFLTSFWLGSSVAHMFALFDVLWVNSGLVPTTIIEQPIVSGAMPARDNLGSVNGGGLMIGILVTTVTANAGSIANMTVNYTNSAGVAGRTATMAAFPITAVVGTVVWFQLQAGDIGVRSIQGITFGTSLVSGAVSLIVARQLAGLASIIANNGGVSPLGWGVKLYDGTCALLAHLATATTATNVWGGIVVEER